MDPFDRAKNYIRSLEKSINPTIKETVERNDDVLIGYQTDEMYKGLDSKGSVIKPSYSRVTISIKESRRPRQPTNRVTLKDKGDLYKSVSIQADSTEFKVSIGVKYADYLVKKYGDDVIGIKKELLKDFVNNYIVPNIKQKTVR